MLEFLSDNAAENHNFPFRSKKSFSIHSQVIILNQKSFTKHHTIIIIN